MNNGVVSFFHISLKTLLTKYHKCQSFLLVNLINIEVFVQLVLAIGNHTPSRVFNAFQSTYQFFISLCTRL